MSDTTERELISRITAPSGLVARLELNAASWRRDGAMEGRIGEEEARLNEEAAREIVKLRKLLLAGIAQAGTPGEREWREAARAALGINFTK